MPKKTPPINEATFDITKSGNLFLIHDPARLKPPESSAYYYWYAFLREASYQEGEKKYGPESELWEIFGDVTGRLFMEWWAETAEEVFIHSYGFLQGAEEIIDSKHFTKSWNAGDLVIRIDPRCSSDWIRHCVDKILETWELKGGRGLRNNGTANVVVGRFAFHQLPDVEFLKRFLLVYGYRNETAPVPYKLIYKKLKDEHRIDVWDMPKHRIKSNDGKEMKLEDGSPMLMEFDMDKAVKILEKYKKNADDIIIGVKDGKFPCYTDKEIREA